MEHIRPSIDQLLAELYASVTEPDRFATFADVLRGAMSAHLVAVQADESRHSHRVLRHFMDHPVVVDPPNFADDSSINLYFARSAHNFFDRGVINGSTLFAPGELERTAFYRETLRLIDVHWSMGLCLSASPTGELVALTVSRDKYRKDFEPDAMELARRLLPHLRNVYAMQQRVHALDAMARGMDCLAFAVWCIDADAMVTYANAAAQTMMAAGAINKRGRRLVTCWRPDQPAFQQALEAATRRVDGRRTELMLHDATGCAWSACDVHPIHATALADLTLSKPPAAIVFVHPFACMGEDTAPALSQVFGLTAAETRLACALLRHGSLAESVQESGRCRETLRSHLKALFAKTDTHRQADLIRRLHAAIS